MSRIKSLSVLMAVAMAAFLAPACKKAKSKGESPKSDDTNQPLATSQTQKSAVLFLNMNGLAISQYVFAIKNNDGSPIKIIDLTIDGKNPRSIAGFERAIIDNGTLNPKLIQEIATFFKQGDVRAAMPAPSSAAKLPSEQVSWESMNGAAYIRIRGFEKNVFGAQTAPSIDATIETASGQQKITVSKNQ
jgi:hypothetical protein